MRPLLPMMILCCISPVQAADINLIGLARDKAILVVDGGKPRVLRVGESAQGIKLIRADDETAQIEIDGKRQALRLGQYVSVAPASGGKASITLSADSGGHFFVNGSINGAGIKFLVDTGASTVALSVNDAQRAGIRYQQGERTMMSTAGGVVPAWRVTLDTLTIDGITLNQIEGTVVSTNMPFALLGMSVLNRMEMKREGELMTLTKRY
ncbi:MAG: TIGR02281 family clan AA aspartic protease [Pseudomonadota bacterium]